MTMKHCPRPILVRRLRGFTYKKEGFFLPSFRKMAIMIDTQAFTARRKTDVALSKTILTSKAMAPYFPRFIATFIYSIWHDLSFQYLSTYPTPDLLDFSAFVKDLLQITKLSFSVIILALKYIHRIRTKCENLIGKPGSEYRLFVCTLNLAMKFLVDNTYSNKTWHKLSRIPLVEINMAEVEFIKALGYDLAVCEEKYFAWLWMVDDSFSKFRSILDLGMARQCNTPPLTPTSPNSNSVLPRNLVYQ
jgi:Cyclin